MQDADFLEVPGGESSKKKKNKKNKKKDQKRKKEEEDDEALIDADLGASLEERKAKLKDAVDEYENLDHEDMVSPSYHANYVWSLTASSP